MYILYILIAVFLVSGLLLFIGSVRKLWRRRVIAGGVQCISSLVVLSFAIIIFLVLLNIYTYHVFTDEEPIAELRFEYIETRTFRLYYKPVDGVEQVYVLRGDECRIESRILKWHGLANMFGFETVFRLERLSGRYTNIENELTAERSVYALAKETGVDVWQMAHEHTDFVPWVDAMYGNGVYVPMVSNARYSLSMTNSGLVARATNDVAEEALKDWKINPTKQ